MEKGYLESMTFGLCRDKAQTDLVEQFQYKFAYESDVVTMADSFGTDVAIPLSQSSQVKQLFLCTIMTDLRQVSDCEDDEDAHSGASSNQSLAKLPDMLHVYHAVALCIL